MLTFFNDIAYIRSIDRFHQDTSIELDLTKLLQIISPQNKRLIVGQFYQLNHAKLKNVLSARYFQTENLTIC